jgi:hypothetical protein
VTSNKSISYVGDTPYEKLLIPETYGVFYNEIIKAKVARLFNDDLTTYNCSENFQLC